MNLLEIYELEGPHGLRKLAEATHSSPKYLYQCATERRIPGPLMVRKLVAADPRLKRSELRPDIWPKDEDPPAAQRQQENCP